MSGYPLAPFVLSLVAAWAVAAPVPKGPVTDRTKIEGRWQVESVRKGGAAAPGGLGADMQVEYEFRGDRFCRTVTVAGVVVVTTTADLTYGPAESRQLTTASARAVKMDGTPTPATSGTFGYALVGDNLLLSCRPAEKGSAVDPLKPGCDDIVYVLTRVKNPK